MMDAALAGGFSGVGLTPRTGAGEWLAWARRPDCLEQVGRGLSRRGLRVSDIGLLTLDPELDLEQVRALAVVAEAIGAPRLLVMCRDDDLARAARHLRATADVAQHYGRRIALEPMSYSPLRDVRLACAMLDDAQVPGAGIVLDLFQHERVGLGPDDVTREVTDRLEIVQLCDGTARPRPGVSPRAEALTDRRLPGEGEFALQRYLERLPVHVAMTVEAPSLTHTSLPVDDRARAVGRASRAVLAATPYPWPQPVAQRAE